MSGAGTGTTMGNFYDFSGKVQNVGYFLGAIDISQIVPAEMFKARMDELINTIKSSPKAEGCDEIFIPGEIEIYKQKTAEVQGVDLSPVIVDELTALGEKYGVRFNCELQ